MKSRIKPTRREADILADMVYKETIQALQDETAVGIIATARFFGLGEKRLKKYLDFLVEVKHEYNVHHKDGVIREMLERDLESLHVDASTVFEEIENIKKTQQEIRQLKKQSAVSVKEATELTEKLKQFETYMKGE